MARTSDTLALNYRAQTLLKTLVTRYIRDGQPVGSRTLSKELELELSPATIRNVMADLEDMGLIKAPHTSAGRIPTARGYRLFVDTLLKMQPLKQSETLRLQQELLKNNDANPQEVFEHASKLLSEITHLTAVIMLPRYEAKMLRYVEFLPLSDQRILVIWVMNEHEVQNRIIHTSRSYSPAELQQAANYLNAAFVGKDIHQVRENLLHEMQHDRETMNAMMQAVIEVAEKAFIQPPSNGDYIMSGETHLMGVNELSNVDKLRQLFAAFNQKRDILNLLDQAISANGMQIFIGEESGYEILDECSVVTSPYLVGDQIIGVVGVIGPTRMAYDRIIPIVDVTARLVGAALAQ